MKIHENPILGRKNPILGKLTENLKSSNPKKKIYNKIIFETYDAIWTVWTLAFDYTTMYEEILTFGKNDTFLKHVLKILPLIEKKKYP